MGSRWHIQVESITMLFMWSGLHNIYVQQKTNSNIEDSYILINNKYTYYNYE